MTKMKVTEIKAASILTPQKVGSLASSYDFSLNPYAGCAFSCSYCYVPKFPNARHEFNEWGKWLEVKVNAPELLQKERARIFGSRIFFSSATDPYQYLELKYRLSRRCLEKLQTYQPAKVTMHTRSHLILQDLPLLQSFDDRLSVGVSLTTDDEDIRAQFEPHAPSINRRVQLIRKLREAGVEVYVSMSPLLPCNPDRLIAMVAPYATKVWIDTMRWVEVNTHPELLKKYEKFFEQKNYERVVEYIASHFPRHRRSQPALSPTANMEAMTILDARLIDVEALDAERQEPDVRHIAARSNPPATADSASLDLTRIAAPRQLATAELPHIAANSNRAATADSANLDAMHIATPRQSATAELPHIAANSNPAATADSANLDAMHIAAPPQSATAELPHIAANSNEHKQQKRYDETGPEHYVVGEDSGYTILVNEQYVHKNSVIRTQAVLTANAVSGTNSAVTGSSPEPSGTAMGAHTSPPKPKVTAQRGTNAKSRNDARVTQLKISF